MHATGTVELDFRLTLTELSRGCGVEADRILLLVDAGLLEPTGADPHEWLFAASDLYRARCALRLQHDLGINTPGAALAVDLIEELQRTRRRLQLLEALFDRNC
ncbi:MAG: MerR family transcriptional regulator [Gammaproteobacteria bacterium]|nr:MerR family transcriptional regulator [Gammaproteobacteria bacterium]